MEIFPDIQSFLLDSQSRATIGTAIIMAVAYIFKRMVSPKSRLAWGVPHQFSFRLLDPNKEEVVVRTREIWVQNTGSLRQKT